MDSLTHQRIPTCAGYWYPARRTKRLITRIFEASIRKGRVGLQFDDEIVEVGSGQYVCTIAPPTLLRLLALLAKPDYRLPHSFTMGHWCCERGKLYDFLELLTTQERSLLHGWFRLFSANPIRDQIVYKLFPIKVKENIAEHYNTSPEFMKLILGDRLEYTCAFFDEQHATLASAQENKIDLVISRLGLLPQHSVLDLGCGWGQIAEAVVAKVGAQVTGINLSPGQIRYAQEHGSSPQLSFVLTDYESFNPPPHFHRIYSVGMLEHVGRGHLGSYFKKICELLEPEGRALVHCIVRRQHESTNSWIDAEVFPGAYIPQLSEVIEEIECSNLEIVQLFAHDRSNYFRTLLGWSENFYRNQRGLEIILAKHVSPEDTRTILRLWEFYLSGSRLAFNVSDGDCYNVQILLRSFKKDGSL